MSPRSSCEVSLLLTVPGIGDPCARDPVFVFLAQYVLDPKRWHHVLSYTKPLCTALLSRGSTKPFTAESVIRARPLITQSL